MSDVREKFSFKTALIQDMESGLGRRAIDVQVQKTSIDQIDLLVQFNERDDDESPVLLREVGVCLCVEEDGSITVSIFADTRPPYQNIAHVLDEKTMKWELAEVQ